MDSFTYLQITARLSDQELLARRMADENRRSPRPKKEKKRKPLTPSGEVINLVPAVQKHA
jgi:hypothetical protein